MRQEVRVTLDVDASISTEGLNWRIKEAFKKDKDVAVVRIQEEAEIYGNEAEKDDACDLSTEYQVQLEKMQVVYGTVAVNAKSKDDAVNKVQGMVKDRALHATHEDISWGEPQYVDFSFQTTGEAEETAHHLTREVCQQLFKDVFAQLAEEPSAYCGDWWCGNDKFDVNVFDAEEFAGEPGINVAVYPVVIDANGYATTDTMTTLWIGTLADAVNVMCGKISDEEFAVHDVVAGLIF